VNVALPVIGRYFDADAATLGWVATSYMLATAAALVPVGRAADKARYMSIRQKTALLKK